MASKWIEKFREQFPVYPTLIPNRIDTDTGIGWVVGCELKFVVGNLRYSEPCINAGESAFLIDMPTLRCISTTE